MCPKISKIYYFTKKFQQNQPKKPKISLKINQKPIFFSKSTKNPNFFLEINQKTKKYFSKTNKKPKNSLDSTKKSIEINKK